MAFGLLALPGATTPAAQADPPTATLGDGPTPIPLKNAAMIKRTTWGYRYIAGQQNSDLTVSFDGTRVRYVDTGTRELRAIPKRCTPEPASVGIAVSCSIPPRFADRMFLEIWPRLGDDIVDGSSLPAQFRLWVLGDAGDDTFRGGAGADFFNGAKGDDLAFGGDGDDWIRTGLGDDELWGGPGDDRLVGVEGKDVIHGEEGDDRLGGGPADDRLWGEGGVDRALCEGGKDVAYLTAGERSSGCESVLAG